MSLTVEPADATTTWTLRLENMDSVPIRIIEDWRLLSLEVTPPPPPHGRAVTRHCVLPAVMRPTTDEDHVLILAPRASHLMTVDPRAFCFDGAQARALIPGASVVAHFGFSPDRANPASPPLVATPDEPSADRAGVKEVVSESFLLPELPPLEVEPGESDAASPVEAAAESPTLTVSTPPRVDSDNIRDLSLTVTVTNPTARRVTLLLSPHTIAIDATNHFGVTFPCQWEMPPTAIAELFTTIPPRGRASTTVLVAAMCPPQFLAWPGLYTLRASVDTRRIPTEQIGIHAFTGRVTAAEPTLVRIRTMMRGGVR
jgi:hypothetical protein